MTSKEKTTMFTGIVETIGVVSELHADDSGTTLTISSAADVLTDCHLGDSISVNGTCLTVIAFESPSFKVGVAPETLRRTNLGALSNGCKVNLERAVLPNTRMGGHFVQGHVDTIAKIVKIKPDGEALTLRFKPRDKKVLLYVVEKGFIAIDGASLTVTKVDDVDGWFEVMLISYTQDKVVTAAKKVGEEVNIEVDMVGKYVEKALSGYIESSVGDTDFIVLQKIVERIVDSRLLSLGK